MTADTDWRPDVLGPGFEQLTLPLGEDSEGEVVATLVRHLPAESLAERLFGDRMLPDRRPLSDVDVLYVHGWSDYFFQTRLARFFAERGARFFALDLRKYGRSLRPGQTPGYITDLETYDADIAAALAAMDRGERRLVLLGHSTGGLTLSLWACRHPGRAAALVLNSPWLEFQFSGLARAALAPIVELGARLRPLDVAAQVNFGYYARAQREVADPHEPLETNLQWRPDQTMAIYPGWFHAVLEGQERVAAGLRIDAPLCVLLSARSALPTRWSEELTRVDSVLNVDEVARAALKLGSSVTVERIDGAIHDVFLSRHAVRDEAYARLHRWMRGFIGER